MSLLLGGLGGGLMCRIKTPQQDYALKMQGGGAYLRDTTIYFWWYWKHYVLLHCNLTFNYCSYSIAVFILLKIIDCRFTPGHLEEE